MDFSKKELAKIIMKAYHQIQYMANQDLDMPWEETHMYCLRNLGIKQEQYDEIKRLSQARGE